MAAANLWRQAGFFNPNDLGENKVHIVGAGATGSHIADTLASMGIYQLAVYDFDTVEDHNLPNQIYKLSDIGKPKVEALKQHILDKMGFEIEAYNQKVEKIENLKGYLVLCTDSMEVQKSIMLLSARLNRNCIGVVETRMGIDQGRVYFFDPNDKLHLSTWNDRWYPDSAALESPCNQRSISMTAKLLASLAAGRIIIHQRRINKRDSETVLYNESIIHICGNIDNNVWE